MNKNSQKKSLTVEGNTTPLDVSISHFGKDVKTVKKIGFRIFRIIGLIIAGAAEIAVIISALSYIAGK